MTSTTVAQYSKSERSEPLITRSGWLWIAVLGGLFIWFFQHPLQRSLFIIAESNSWLGALKNLGTGRFNQDWSHGLIVPLIALYFIHQNRDRLMELPRRICWWGLPLVFLGMLSFAWWWGPGRNDMLQSYSMILTLMGLVLFLLGSSMFKVLWFPVAYLALGVKISDRPWERLANSLQDLAAKGATVTIQLIGVPLSIEARATGSEIFLFHHGKPILPPLTVAEVCAGLHMLMAFIALGVAIAFLSNRPIWQRLILMGMTIPVAVAVNIGRIAVTGLLSVYHPDMAKGEFHIFVGMLMLIPAAGLFLLLASILERIIIYDDKPGSASSASTTPKPPIYERIYHWTRLRRLMIGPYPTSAALVTRVPIERETETTRSMIAGVGVGVLLAGLVGWNYLMLWATYRPEEITGGLLTASQARWAFWAGGVLIAAISVGLWRWRHSPAAAKAGHTFAQSMCAGILLTACLGLEGIRTANGIVVIKERVDLRNELDTVPSRVGSWIKMREEILLPDIVAELGSNRYINRVYQDSSRPADAPGSVVVLQVVYYTGSVDTVPHVPERCYTAHGALDSGKTTIKLKLMGPAYEQEGGGGWIAHRASQPMIVRLPASEFDAALFQYAPKESPSDKSSVIYFFAANGKFLASPDLVRLHGFDPRDRYSYYCKIELLMPQVQDSGAAGRVAGEFLSQMMPEILAVLPDWKDVSEGRWPLKKAAATRPVGE